jgi:hypothetical protein
MRLASSLIRRKSIALAAVMAAAAFSGIGLSPLSAHAQAKPSKTKHPDLPYTTIDHPQFVSASQASFLGPNDIVLGVAEGTTAKAYPAAILAQHGVVQDRMPDGPIAVTW